MPFVRIDIQAGKPAEYRRQLLAGVRDAIVSALGAPDDSIMSRIIESQAEDIDAPARSDRLTIIEISMLPGRGPELKERLYDGIVANLGKEPGVDADDIMVMVNDPSAECFALGGVMQCTIKQPVGEDE
ncbi:MAG: tautomerase family protein [Coriobacteriia bacterium]